MTNTDSRVSGVTETVLCNRKIVLLLKELSHNILSKFGTQKITFMIEDKLKIIVC